MQQSCTIINKPRQNNNCTWLELPHSSVPGCDDLVHAQGDNLQLAWLGLPCFKLFWCKSFSLLWMNGTSVSAVQGQQLVLWANHETMHTGIRFSWWQVARMARLATPALRINIGNAMTAKKVDQEIYPTRAKQFSQN
eukprot:1890802-Amphidinium_carterae.1